MKNKKELVEHLDKEILDAEKMYVSNEASYRSLQAMVMASRKPDDNVQGALTNAKKMKEGISAKLRHLRGIREEVDKGTFEL